VHGGRPVFFVTGRLKEIIIRDAEKYSPLRSSAARRGAARAVGQARRPGFAHTTHGEEVGAYIEIDALDDALRARSLAAIDAMPVAERPKVVLHGTEPIPRTHTGKIQRRKMQPWFAAWVRGAPGPIVLRREASPSGPQFVEHHPVAHRLSRTRWSASFTSAIGAVSTCAPMPCSAANASISRMAAGLPMSLPQTRADRQELRRGDLHEPGRRADEAEDAVGLERLQVRDPVEARRHGAEEKSNSVGVGADLARVRRRCASRAEPERLVPLVRRRGEGRHVRAAHRAQEPERQVPQAADADDAHRGPARSPSGAAARTPSRRRRGAAPPRRHRARAGGANAKRPSIRMRCAKPPMCPTQVASCLGQRFS
jgi:hypothetical protein